MRRRSDRDWEDFGREEPYWSVLTAEVFKRSKLTDEAREAFFKTGESYLDDVLGIIREQVDATFEPRRACDFGCGVGRVVVPLSHRCERVVGVDISASMLTECQRNVEERGRPNVELVASDDELTALSGTFDFIHSVIVFQHIPASRGLRIVERLLEHLEPKGVVALHFKYHPYREAGPVARLVHDARMELRERLRRQGRMQMNAYPLNEIFWLMQRSGLNQCHVRFSHHGRDQDGVLLLGQSNPDIRHAEHF